jgi:hypothetical protein
VSENDFHDQVLAALSDLKVSQAETTVELKGVVARLDRVNGSVGRHEDKLGMLQLELANRAAMVKSDLKGDLTVHILNCPWRPRVEALEAFVIAHQAKDKANDHWLVKLLARDLCGRGRRVLHDPVARRRDVEDRVPVTATPSP